MLVPVELEPVFCIIVLVLGYNPVRKLEFEVQLFTDMIGGGCVSLFISTLSNQGAAHVKGSPRCPDVAFLENDRHLDP